MITPRRLKTRLLVLATVAVVITATKFENCIKHINALPNTTTGGRDNRGNPVIITYATAITYELCLQKCGADPEPVSWPVFAQQFSAWLLPWLALISQLPFGANDKIDNLQSMLLSIGSPVLAAYSLALTALNGRWITRYFFPFQQHPNAYRAVRVLSSLQQAPLRITEEYPPLFALVSLEENYRWWDEVMAWLNMTHSWSISAATSIAWVLIAYIFTMVNSFTEDFTEMVTSNGQAVGSIWLWLLAVVIGWLQISPKCDSVHLRGALKRANSIAEERTGQAVYLSSDNSTLRRDEHRSPPIFNYARLFPWAQAVEQVALAFKTEDGSPGPSPSSSDLENKAEQISEYIPGERTRWGEGTWQRISISACLALFLQWGTTGAAIIVAWCTPTIGLGCRSAVYLLYGTISTLVWMAMLLSSVLSHYSVTSDSQRPLFPRVARGLSIFLRRSGKLAAGCNGIVLLATCLFQFNNYFNNCYCNTSVFYWGSKAYNVIVYKDEDVRFMMNAWIGGIILAAGSSLLFFLFITLLINPPFPSQGNEH